MKYDFCYMFYSTLKVISSNLDNMSEKISSDVWIVKSSDEGKGAINTIGLCEEKHFVEALVRRNPDLELIKLSVGQRLLTNVLIKLPVYQTPCSM